MSYWKSEHFKALQKTWYQRLEDSGFQDQEHLVQGEMRLKEETAPKVLEAMRKRLKEEYFIALTKYVNEAQFRNDVERVVMHWFIAGMRIGEIVEWLRIRGTPRTRFSIRYIIRRFEHKCGLRKYTRKQLNLKSS